MANHFYELHEGAADLLTNALLVSEREFSGEEFEARVRAARAAVLDTFEEDTLSEAIARELERSGEFTYIGDEKLAGSMSVGVLEEETYLVETTDELRTLVVDLDVS